MRLEHAVDNLADERFGQSFNIGVGCRTDGRLGHHQARLRTDARPAGIS
jgi:hypothetical protein